MGAVSEFEYRYNMTMKIFHSHPEPGFESPGQQETVWGQQWGCDNDVGTLRKVLMHRPGDEMKVIDPSKRLEHLGSYGDVENQSWYWRGDTIPTLEEQQAQHDGLANALRAEGVEVVYLKRCAPGKHKSIYTRDSVIGVKGGAIVTRLGPIVRRGEEAPATETLASIGMPILRTIHGTGIMEGGSFAWLKPGIAAIGRSNRVNEEGTRQVEEVLKAQGCELLRVDLTGYRLHIDGAMVMIDVDTAIINPTQLPFWFLEKLKEMKIRTIEVNPEDPSGAVNCIAVKPGRLIMEAGLSPRTAETLDKLGIEIVDVKYDKIWLGGGGIHCSTSPLIRDSI
ncbi:MAG: amidinotransferase [Alphaproteobacteria bacterium]|nr:amidinotransferase [Alphaproteobacteria bacterium]MBU0798139.1 amidinotransferase [Alphaproteobacteria bacterium]MBU0887044.1 amidinotransferase [Alphaproteobacteria bacterium]MBU1814294.1 amidinotransferase [Alphaproteobacteria bacterium]MBU2089263.1 amidinotransferase [Alphaproteobacteria bacterium]